MNLKAFSPCEVVRECARLLSTAAQAKGLRLNLAFENDLPQQIYGDPYRLEQILLNLGGNAIKFTGHGGTVSISGEVLTAGKHQTTLMFSVEDSGIGIDTADREALFNPFSRIEKSTKGIVGTGLGLVISKRLIELMGGEIKFVSEPNHGSNFWFWVPFGTVPEESKISSPIVSALSKEPELLSRHRILVVEDNAVLSELAARQLALLGAHSDCVFNGADAIAAWQKIPYDIILLDIHLPDISGHEVAKRIRSAKGRYADQDGGPVIIAMTAGAMPGDREKVLESGMNDYLAKPVNLAQLGETVIKWATQIEAQRLETGGKKRRRGA